MLSIKHRPLSFFAGLNENDLVKCALVADVSSLRNVFVTPVSAKDWEIFVGVLLNFSVQI